MTVPKTQPIGFGLDRDPIRTPIQGKASMQPGFPEAQYEPWFPLGIDYEQVPVENQLRHAPSMIALYYALLKIRASSRALQYGSRIVARSTHSDKHAIIQPSSFELRPSKGLLIKLL